MNCYALECGVVFCFWLTTVLLFKWCPLNSLLTEAEFSSAESFQQLAIKLFSKTPDFPSWILLVPSNPKNSSGTDFQDTHLRVARRNVWLESVHCLVYVLLLPFQIISFGNNNKLYLETIQGWKEVVPVLLLKTVLGPRCFDRAEVHCFLPKFSKDKFVCIRSCAHANFPSVAYSLQG